MTTPEFHAKFARIETHLLAALPSSQRRIDFRQLLDAQRDVLPPDQFQLLVRLMRVRNEVVASPSGSVSEETAALLDEMLEALGIGDE